MFNCLLFNVSSTGEGPRPIGVYRIATVLRENGWDAEVIDFVPFWTLEQLKELARNRIDNNTKFFGFGYLFARFNKTVDDFCKWLKIEYPNIVLIYGTMHEVMTETDIFDYYVTGYADIAIIELVNYLFSNGPRPRFQLLNTFGKKILPSLENYPAYPMKKLYNIYEDRDFIQPFEWLHIEISRGCRFECAFCTHPILGVKEDYSRDVEDFEIQLKDSYDRFGTTNYYITDDTFNDRLEKITKFANLVETLSFKPWFSAFIRADLIATRQQELEELNRMGVVGHFYGVESFNQKSAKSIGKGYNSEKIKDTLLRTKEYFIKNNNGHYRGTISLIAGLPYETMESLANTRDWLFENWRDQNFHLNPLFVQLGDLYNSSKIAMDYSKYGYTAMTKSDMDTHDLTLLKKINPNFFNNEKLVNMLLWKNEHTDLFTVEEFIYHAKNTDQYCETRLGGLSLGYYSNDNIDARLQKKVSGTKLTPKRINLIDKTELFYSYIMNKLNYTKKI